MLAAVSSCYLPPPELRELPESPERGPPAGAAGADDGGGAGAEDMPPPE